MSRIGRVPTLTIYGAASLVLAGVAAAACSSGPADESAASTSDALTATLSGTVTDTAGRPLQGVTMTLSGRTQATQSTGAAGTYAFNVNVPDATASWAIMPGRTGCTFTPSVVNLNNINGNRTANFVGTGATCVGTAAVDAGASNAVDPGPRPGPLGAGVPAVPSGTGDSDNVAQQAAQAAACFPGLGPDALLMCEQSILRFQEVDSVSGDGANGEDGTGLGPGFNANGCHVCHAQPGVLGSSPGLTSPQHPVPNPQVELATHRGATNPVPSFITANGPVREARFPNALGGGVADLFSIAGRDDATGCNLAQPNFARQLAIGDIIFRIPTPTFGLGLVENTSDETLLANAAATPAGAPSNATLGITPVFNRTGNDGTITRFGWKAQNKSLLVFAGEAYNVEQGIANEVFGNERNAVAGCVFNGGPEDRTDPAVPTNNDNFDPVTSDYNSDVNNFAFAMRLSAPPKQATAPFTIGTTTVQAGNISNGLARFVAVGCANCHSQTLVTGNSAIDPAMNNVTYHPFSDFAVHHMGTGLADNVPQGGASADQFRSAPLWGVGQRLFFLHDGRTSSLVAAIEAHASAGSEANTVIRNFNALSAANQEDVILFLRSL